MELVTVGLLKVIQKDPLQMLPSVAGARNCCSGIHVHTSLLDDPAHTFVCGCVSLQAVCVCVCVCYLAKDTRTRGPTVSTSQKLHVHPGRGTPMTPFLYTCSLYLACDACDAYNFCKSTCDSCKSTCEREKGHRKSPQVTASLSSTGVVLASSKRGESLLH
jgi:hypothetical protein